MQAGVGQPGMDAVDVGARLGASAFGRREASEGTVRIVAAEAVTIVLRHDAARIDEPVRDQVAVRVVTG